LAQLATTKQGTKEEKEERKSVMESFGIVTYSSLWQTN
jgi:hypothetical protein